MITENPFEKIFTELAAIKTDIQSLKPIERPSIISDSLTKEQAIQFLAENGLPMKDGQFYSLTSTGKIPAKRIGKRLVLSRKELKMWLESKTVQIHSSAKESAKILAETANKRIGGR